MDATENKKLRRKQSNRESARRSRLRKQAECEALTSTVTELQQENCHLKAANKAMVQQIEELAAKLEEVCSQFVNTSARDLKRGIVDDANFKHLQCIFCVHILMPASAHGIVCTRFAGSNVLS